MSNDSFTVTSSRSWFSRIGGAIVGALFGLVLFFGSFPLLIWNEARAIDRAKTLQEGGKIVISIPSEPLESTHEGKLVHVTGEAKPAAPVTDPLFGIDADVISLRRDVEMYQWAEAEKSETKKKLGGGEETVTTYTYKKEWSDRLIDSDNFHRPEGHQNPSSLPADSETFPADEVTVGAFTLPPSLVGMIDNFTPWPVQLENEAGVSEEFRESVHVAQGGFYLGADPKTPQIGDARVTFSVAKPGTVSLIARQIGDTFEPYSIGNLGTIELLQTGAASADSMFQAELQGNALLTWVLRFVGFFVMFLGMVLIANPLSVLADVVPLFGTILGAGVNLLALTFAVPLTLITIALAWLAFRPLLGIPLLLAAVAAVVLGIRAIRRKAPAPAPTATA